jgi:hypothetical protein
MAPNRTSKSHDPISKSRAMNASILTVLTLFFVLVWISHGVWAIKVLINDTYGTFFNNLIYGPGTLVLNIGLGIKLMSWINIKLLDNSIEDDYKKFI